MDTIVQELPQFDINSCYISLYDGEVKNHGIFEWHIPDYYRLVLAFTDKVRISLKNCEKRFKSINLVPKIYLPKNKRYTIILMPLFFVDEHFGFIIFELGSRIEIIYETLRAR